MSNIECQNFDCKLSKHGFPCGGDHERPLCPSVTIQYDLQGAGFPPESRLFCTTTQEVLVPGKHVPIDAKPKPIHTRCDSSLAHR